MMKKLALLALVVGLGGYVAAAGLGPPHIGFWVDGELYRTIGTPTNLPNHGPTDGLYIFQDLEDGGLDGQTPVAESKPGDRDYNGGRWDATVLTFTEEGRMIHDPDMDGVVNFELTSWEQVEQHIALGHLEVVGPGPRFECPVIEN